MNSRGKSRCPLNLRHDERKRIHTRIRHVLKAWPVRWTEEKIVGGPLDAVDFVVGDTETRFIVRVLYPDEACTSARPDAVQTLSRRVVVNLCLKYLDH